MLEEIVPLVNKVARIIHDTAHEYKGLANKNVGDAFLLLWKFDADYGLQADSCVFATMKILARIATNQQQLIDGITRPARVKLLSRCPKFRVRIGCGMHVGWAVEGAIGSKRKIDPTYLSPHINLTTKLEELTKDYSTHIMLSGPLFSMCSRRCQGICRLIDRLQLPYSPTLYELFSPKTNLHHLNYPAADFTPKKSPMGSAIDRVENSLRKVSSLSRMKIDPKFQKEQEREANRNMSPLNPNAVIDTKSNTGSVAMSASSNDPPSPRTVGSPRRNRKKPRPDGTLARLGATPVRETEEPDQEETEALRPDFDFSTDPDIAKLQFGFNEGFDIAYNNGVNLFLAGSFAEARAALDITNHIFQSTTGYFDPGIIWCLMTPTPSAGCPNICALCVSLTNNRCSHVTFILLTVTESLLNKIEDLERPSILKKEGQMSKLGSFHIVAGQVAPSAALLSKVSQVVPGKRANNISSSLQGFNSFTVLNNERLQE